MKIIYENLRNSEYLLGEHDEYNIFFRSKNTLSDMTIEPITLYDSKITSDDKIYIELANAEFLASAHAFCNKYGVLFPPNELLYEIYRSIENFEDYEHKPLYDYFLYSHFKFYHLTMNSLLNIYSILQKDVFSPDDPFELFKHSISLITNPCYQYYFQIIFYDKNDMYDISNVFSNNYPLMKFICLISTDSSKYHIPLYQEPSIDILLEKISSFPNNHFGQFIKSAFSQLDQINELSESRKVPSSFYKQEYFKRHKTNCINFAKYVFSQILSFLIKDCVPVVNFSSFDNISSWKFTSLADAIFFYFYIDCSNGNIYKVCANEYCKKLFACSPSYTKKIYCSNRCAHKVANRKYKNKNKHKN